MTLKSIWNFFFAILISTLGRFNRANKNKSVIYTLTCLDCLVAGISHFFGQFSGELEVLAVAKIHPVGNYFPKENRVPQLNVFSSSNVFFIKLFLANIRKNRGSPCSFKRKGEFVSLSSLV